MNTPINFELAKFLKEKGFNTLSLIPFLNKRELKQLDYGELWLDVYLKDKSLIVLNNGSFGHRSDFEFIAPTIAEVVMWLYEKHGIWVMVRRIKYKSLIRWDFYVNGNYPKQNLMGYNSPTEAYEAAIEHVLKNLINEGKEDM